MRRNFRIGPYLLIILGGIFLLNNFGVLPWEIWNSLWKFWPVILILLGIEILIGHTISFRTLLALLVLIFLIPIAIAINPITKNPLVSEKAAISQDLGNLTKAKIVVDLPATAIDLKAADPSSNKLLEGHIEFSKASSRPKVEREERFGQGVVTITQPHSQGIPFVTSLKNKTFLALSGQVALEIIMKTGASSGTLDLSHLRVDYLEINSRASNLTIKFSDLYGARAIVNTNASNVDIWIPEKMEARIKVDSQVKNLSITSRFKKVGSTYQTEGFDKAFTRVDIDLEAVASSITVK